MLAVYVILWTFSVKNCFKYFLINILEQNVSKNQRTKILNYIRFLCAKLFLIVFNIYFGTFVPKKSDKKNYQNS